jgi:hypothetical protein
MNGTRATAPSCYLRADNPEPRRRLGVNGEPLRWILEIHFVDRASGFGGFQEAPLFGADERA